MNSKALYGAVLLGTVASLFVACGDGDSTKIVICNNKQVTCLNAQGGEVCSADGTLKLPFDCGLGETCCDPNANPDGCTDYSSGEGGGNATELTRAGCVGACQPNTTECASSRVSRVCSEDGRAWIPIACPAGTGCDDATGTCTRSENPDDTVTVCEQGQSTCADQGSVKECEEDGSNWVYKPCPAGTACTNGACVVNEDVECVPHTGVCHDRRTSLVCNDEGTGYEEVDCGDMECIDGLCRGPVCTKGETRCDDLRNGNVIAEIVAGTYQPTVRYICNADGTAWDIVHCDAGEICVYDNIAATTINAYIEDIKRELGGSSASLGSLPSFDIPETSQAECVEPECAAPYALRELVGDYYLDSLTGGSFVCGEPNGDNPLDSFSLCEGLAPYHNLHWANYACPDDTQCRYDGQPTQSEGESGPVRGPVCAQTCRPGSVACFQTSTGGSGTINTTGEATIECGPDGEWDYTSIAACPDNDGREQWCGPNLMGGNDYDIGTCMEPACAYWFQAYDTFALPEGVGACANNGDFFQCRPDGTFGSAQDDCASCVVETRAAGANNPDTYAGYDPGTCTGCVDGQRSCVITYDPITGAGTPFYEECNDGAWRVRSCADGDICRDFVNRDQDSDLYGLGDIICGGECTPFTTECGGTMGQQIRSCGANGNWRDFGDCPTGACTTDQTSSFGVASCEAECVEDTFTCSGGQAVPCTGDLRFDYENPVDCAADDRVCVENLGCVECDNGSGIGRPATRCNPDDRTQIQACQPNSTWGDPVDCPSNQPVCSGTNPSAVCAADPGTGGTAGTAGTGGDGGTAGGGGMGGTAGNAGNAGGGMGGTGGIAGIAGIPIDSL